ncbi:aspartate aminotransferase family protein [Dasania sp. GY-MA-18]|uniref:Aspartate aminotransferase family protein n=1 Tax=Dasania phycosphaerae TaxID=2950436 RepID=A0A9J6RLB8_9GAMM|nr:MULTISPECIES: aspartate aminotransferase family protein [Dasania]MCR8922860.1 aspartate aminotransferase family protein [Dasania sp. GY-MA-18]MCZ0865291.1 aspartate aminotransferase family protein [Dasania phycosphaerae]MCZ0869016.1 aspartate aminotransferase family protein [Dasania phycosphaerae]
MTQHSTKDFQAADAQHYLHPFTDFKDLASKGSRIITKAEGAYIYTNDGQKLLDGMSGLWCCNLGYTQPAINKAVADQMNELPYYNSFFQCSHPAAIELSKELASVSPAHMNNVFYTNSGSEGNDTVLRLVRRYWDLKKQPNKRVIISRENAYHGSTVAAASLGGMSYVHNQFGKLPNIEHVAQPYWFKEGGELSREEFGVQAAKALEDKILELGVENVAAFIAEPIQGAGGVIIPPETYWPEVQKILNKYDILFVSDEVIFGFGRTGKWFGCDYYGTKPDLINFAKAVTNGFQPLGGVMIGDKVADVLKSDGGEFAHGFTYSGHPAACAAALATIKIMKDENIVDKVANDLGPYFGKRMAELSDHPMVGEVRTLGMVGAIELVKNKETRERYDSDGTAGATCRDASIANDLVMRATGDNMIIAPPLTLTHEQIDELVTKAKAALDQAYETLQAKFG